MARLVLDTNIISQILRRNAAVLARLGETADRDDDLFMCPVVFYELWRGLSYRGADRQLDELNAFARSFSGPTTTGRCGLTPRVFGLNSVGVGGRTMMRIC